ncbi:MAG: TIM barrel protein [Pirellulaceae bacterium]
MLPKLSVCIDAVFEGCPLPQAVETVAKCGYEAFEFWRWWDKDLSQVLAARERWGVNIAACCTKFVSLVDPQLRQKYLAGLKESIGVAQSLGCPVLISQVGDALPGVSRHEQHKSLVDGLRESANLLDGSGVTLAIEPLNEIVDHAGYYLVRSDEAFEIVEEVGSSSVKVTFDIYHQQISEGHLIRNMEKHIDKIAHFHAAGNPGRHELTSGEINYEQVFAAIAQTSYDGYVGLEYWPIEPAVVGLRQVAQMAGR